VNCTTVVLADMPRMLTELVRALLEPEPDFILEPLDASPRALGPGTLEHADVLILADNGWSAEDYAEILYVHPRLRLLALDHRGASTCLYELCPHRRPLGELSPEMIRTAVRRPPAGLRGT
jgi:hypothetical protein